MRRMFDAVNPGNIPVTAQMVAGYVDGLYAWSLADWARFPHAVKVRAAVSPFTNDGHVLDVEAGDASPDQAPGWAQMRRAAGVHPTIYTGYGYNGQTWALVINAFHNAGIAEPEWWIAAMPGNGPNLYPGTVAHQYAGGITAPYDTSAVADYWPGVDPTPPPPVPPVIIGKDTTMMIIQAPQPGGAIYKTDGFQKVHINNMPEVQWWLKALGQTVPKPALQVVVDNLAGAK